MVDSKVESLLSALGGLSSWPVPVTSLLLGLSSGTGEVSIVSCCLDVDGISSSSDSIIQGLVALVVWSVSLCSVVSSD